MDDFEDVGGHLKLSNSGPYAQPSLSTNWDLSMVQVDVNCHPGGRGGSKKSFKVEKDYESIHIESTVISNNFDDEAKYTHI